MPLTGRCLCGEVSYTSDSDPLSVTYCHCDDCRRVTGSAFNVGVSVPASTFQLSGKTKGYESTNDEGLTKRREFCPECGSQLFTRYPDLVFIKAGTLDNSEDLRPTREIWTEMVVPWSKIPDGLHKFPRGGTQRSWLEELSIRKAEATDSDFVFAVKKAAFREYVEQIWGWDDTYQRDLHNRRFASQDIRIIHLCGTDVGFLSTSNTSDTLNVDQIYILPEYQGRGIGAACMRRIIDDASLEQKPVTLQVLKINTRATAFYERLGFTIVDENSTHFQMKRLPQ